MSDATQSIIRLTLLASATAGFMAVWTGDSAATIGMTLAERNRDIVPAHALGPIRELQPVHKPQIAQPQSPVAPPVVTTPQVVAVPQVVAPAIERIETATATTSPAFDELPAGSYRIVYEDGRVERLTIIDRGPAATSQFEASISTVTVEGQTAHLIRVAELDDVAPELR